MYCLFEILEKLNNIILLIWKLLNTNIISSLIGALVFGLFANYLFARFEDRRVSKEVISKLIKFLIDEIEVNIKTAQFIQSFEKNQCHTTPEPFHLVALEVSLKSPFFHKLSPEAGAKIISVLEDLSEVNQIQSQYHQMIFGPAAALTNTPKLKEHLFSAISAAMPNGQKELNELKSLLEKDLKNYL